MKRALASAFTLTEMLVVLAIFGLIASLAAVGAPGMFQRANLRQAAARLSSDLDLAAMQARREGAFGALEATPDHNGYRVRLGGVVVLTRALPRNVRLKPTALNAPIDPAGRWGATTFSLEDDDGEIDFTTDPITGRAIGAGNGAYGSPRRRGYPGRRYARVSAGHRRGPRRPRQRKTSRASDDDSDDDPPGRKADLVDGSLFRRARRLYVGLALPSFARRPKPASGFGGVFNRGDAPGRHNAARFFRDRMGDPARGLAPAMTLLELMVALAILSLSTALAFSNIGPWLAQSRTSANEAAFWRSAAPAQLLLTELTTAAIDPSQRQMDQSSLRFRALAPRLSARPIHVVLTVEREGQGSRLVFSSPDLGARNSVVLEHAPPLQFSADSTAHTVVLEAERNGAWIPLATAAFAADAPFVCAFDPIPRTCR